MIFNVTRKHVLVNIGAETEKVKFHSKEERDLTIKFNVALLERGLTDIEARNKFIQELWLSMYRSNI